MYELMKKWRLNIFLFILQGFYDEVSNPMLLDVELNYPENEIEDVTKNSFKHFYDGSEIVVAGRFRDINQNSLTVDVKGEGVSMDFLDYFLVMQNIHVQNMAKLKIVTCMSSPHWQYVLLHMWESKCTKGIAFTSSLGKLLV